MLPPGRSRNARTNAVLSVPAAETLIGRRGYPVLWDDADGGVKLIRNEEPGCGVLLTGDAAIGEHVSIATLGYAGTLMIRVATSVKRFSVLKLAALMPEAIMIFGEPVDGIHGPDTYVAYALEAGSAGALIEAALLPRFFHEV